MNLYCYHYHLYYSCIFINICLLVLGPTRLISINDVRGGMATKKTIFPYLTVPKLLAVSEISLIPLVSKQVKQMLPKVCYEIQQHSIQLDRCIRCCLAMFAKKTLQISNDDQVRIWTGYNEIELIIINLASLRTCCCAGQYRIVKLSLHHISKKGGVPLKKVQAALPVVQSNIIFVFLTHIYEMVCIVEVPLTIFIM